MPRAQRTEPEAGLQRKASEAKQLREAAKLLDKRVAAQVEWWRTGQKWRCLSWEAFRRLQAEADQAWDIAHRKSYESGFPFTDRWGIRRNDEPRDLVGLALREWCAQHAWFYT